MRKTIRSTGWARTVALLLLLTTAATMPATADDFALERAKPWETQKAITQSVGHPNDIWSDLAAERGRDRRLISIREKMWSELSAPERAQVEQQGLAYYDRYGDAVAKRRQIAAMKRFASAMTGSRTGFANSRLEIQAPPHGNSYRYSAAGAIASATMQADYGAIYAEERLAGSAEVLADAGRHPARRGGGGAAAVAEVQEPERERAAALNDRRRERPHATAARPCA